MNQLLQQQTYPVPMTTLHIAYPQELLPLGNMQQHDLEQLAREALFVHLYERRCISSGKAAEILGISRRQFLDLLGLYHVSVFDDTMDLQQEVQHATAAHCMQHQPID